MVEGKILVHQFLAPKTPENNGKLKNTTEQQQNTPTNTEKHDKNSKNISKGLPQLRVKIN